MLLGLVELELELELLVWPPLDFAVAAAAVDDVAFVDARARPLSNWS